MVASNAAGAGSGEASPQAVLRKIRLAVARMRRDQETAAASRLNALARDLDVLADRLEDMDAEAAYLRTRGQPSIPDAVLGRLLEGESPLRVWREYRGLTLRGLAARSRLGASTLSEIETGATEGSVSALRRIASALDVTIDDLIPSRPS